MKRRRFIFSLLGGAALGWTGWKVGSEGAFLRSSHAGVASVAGNLAKVSQSSRALGTQVTLTVFHQDIQQAEGAIAKAFDEVEMIEQLMSLYRPDSQLSQLNQNGILANPHPYLLEVLETAAQLSRQTDGAFDVSIQPLYTLYAQHAQTGTTADASQISQTLQSVDWQDVKFSEEAVHLRKDGAAVTLNGIAQGFASDAIARVLRGHGIEHALIDSGEIGVLGDHVKNDHWTIGIKHPRNRGDLMALAHLEGRCLATSGDYETRFGPGYQFHHLLDPRTGQSANELSSVSVAAPTAMLADALSTAVFVSGLQKGKTLIESTPGADALFVTKQGKVTRTSGFPLAT